MHFVLEFGDYVSFDDEFRVLYKILDFDDKYVLYYDNEVGYTCYERRDYITKVFKFKECDMNG